MSCNIIPHLIASDIYDMLLVIILYTFNSLFYILRRRIKQQQNVLKKYARILYWNSFCSYYIIWWRKNALNKE